MTPVLRVHGLTKNYVHSHLGKTTVSRGIVDLHFEVHPGEIFGLLGLNGSGKTTTLKLILGLLFPTHGTIEMFGKPAPSRESQRRIGYLPEVPYFYRNLNPIEVLTLYGSLSKLEAHSLPGRIDEVLQIVHMTHAREKPMKEFSKGMLQRIGLAQAILHNPDFLILDEPVTGLDPLGIRQSRQLMADLNQQGKTILFSSHSISELERLAHRVAILVDGKLVSLLDRSQWADKSGRLEEIFIETLESQGANRPL
jgi:ABC-2 type transport system ATP-binding protein